MRCLLVPVLLLLAAMPPAAGEPFLADDAGSGRDAPNNYEEGVHLASGRVYEGNLTGFPLDAFDIYTIDVTPGAIVEARLSDATYGCIYVYDQTLSERAAICSGGTVEQGTARATADAAARWFVRVSFSEPQAYRFSVGIGEPAPNPALTPELFGDAILIQPGAQVRTPQGSCTLNFVYDGTGARAGKVYIGTAAHCFRGLHQTASLDGLGVFGRVVYLGDYGGINTGTFENGIPGAQVDFALIEVDPSRHALVDAEVRGHPGLPTGDVLPRSGVVIGDRLEFSGYGTGFGASKPTREERFGIYTVRSGNTWNSVSPIMPGDSGGPVLHAQTGRAMGVATHLSALGAGGVYLDSAIAEATAAGYPVKLRSAS